MPYSLPPTEFSRKPLATERFRLNPDHPLNQHLVALWLFNEGMGATVYDNSGNANGTFSNGPSWTGTSYGIAVTTDGSDDYVGSITLGNRLDGKPLSIIARIYVVSLPNSFPRIIDRVYNGQFALYVNATGSVLSFAGKSDLGNTLDGPIQSGSAVPTAQWVTVGCAYDVANVYGYMNGIYQGVTAALAGTNGLATSTAETRIGQRSDAGTSRAGNYIYDYIAIYDYPMFQVRQSESHVRPFGEPSNPRFI